MKLLDALEFKPLSSEAAKRSSNAIIDRTFFHPERGEREEALLRQILSDAAKNNTLITTVFTQELEKIGHPGVLAMSVGKLTIDGIDYPAIVIDFLFVDYRFRGKKFCDDAMKISEALLYFAISQAKEITKLAAARYLILRPDGGKENTKLVDFYNAMKFEYMNKKHEWMYLKLS